MSIETKHPQKVAPAGKPYVEKPGSVRDIPEIPVAFTPSYPFLWQLYQPGNVLIFQVRREIFLELEACVAEMRFNRAFRAIQTSGNLFYR